MVSSRQGGVVQGRRPSALFSSFPLGQIACGGGRGARITLSPTTSSSATGLSPRSAHPSNRGVLHPRTCALKHHCDPSSATATPSTSLTTPKARSRTITASSSCVAPRAAASPARNFPATCSSASTPSCSCTCSTTSCSSSFDRVPSRQTPQWSRCWNARPKRSRSRPARATYRRRSVSR